MIVAEDLTGMTRGEAEVYLKQQSLTANFWGSGETVTGQIPAAGELGLYVLYTGNDGNTAAVVVKSQKIPAGTEVSTGTTIQLEFTDTGARD